MVKSIMSVSKYNGLRKGYREYLNKNVNLTKLIALGKNIIMRLQGFEVKKRFTSDKTQIKLLVQRSIWSCFYRILPKSVFYFVIRSWYTFYNPCSLNRN